MNTFEHRLIKKPQAGIQFHFEEYLSLLRLIGRDGNDGNDEALSRITFTLAEAVPTSVLEPTMFLLLGTGLLELVELRVD